MATKDALGDRMKEYENVHRAKVTRRTPLVIRVDGKAFHTYTKGLKRPYSTDFMNVMDEVARILCSQIQGTKFAYVQSDEISIVTRNDGTLKTDVWLSGNIQKMVSVSASIAGVELTMISDRVFWPHETCLL